VGHRISLDPGLFSGECFLNRQDRLALKKTMPRLLKPAVWAGIKAAFEKEITKLPDL